MRPIWRLPLAALACTPGRQHAVLQQGDGLRITLSEEAIRDILTKLRPALVFARQGLEASAVASQDAAPATSAARCRLYSLERTAQHEAVARARRRLANTLATAERAREALALLGVLHSQRSAFRVLHSEALDGGARERLASTPLQELVSCEEALAPVVQLCTAMVVESGLATPAADAVFGFRGRRRPCDGAAAAVASAGSGRAAASDLCRELEEQCPAIFRRVDVAFLRNRLGTVEAPGANAASEMLRRCVKSVAPSAPPDPLTTLACSLQTMAAEDPSELAQNIRVTAATDPWGAAQACAERLQQLQRGVSVGGSGAEAFGAHARALLGALLGAVCASPQLCRPKEGALAGDTAGAACQVIEHLLSKTASLGAAVEGALPVAHEAILDYLLSSQQLHRVLGRLLETSTTADVEGFLRKRSRCGDRAAGELLWKRFQAKGQPELAAQVLMQLAGQEETDTPLAERVRLLHLASGAAHQALPSSQATVDALVARLEMASRVQLPLCQELLLLAGDDRVAARWRSAAEHRAKDLQRLVSLQELYQTVSDFGLWHFSPLVSDLSSSVQDQRSVSIAWVNAFFATDSCPYSSGELACRPESKQRAIFPLLMVRREAAFFDHDGKRSAPSEAAAAAPRCQDLRVRASRLIEELANGTRAPSPLWEKLVLACLLEYCSCLWLRALEPTPTGPGSLAEVLASSSRGQSAEDRRNLSWVALEIMQRPPFHCSPAAVVQLYADIIQHLPSWLGELGNMLPADPHRCRPALGEDDLTVHLGSVLVAALRHAGGAEQLEVVARSAADAALARLRARLPAIRGREALRESARRLLGEAEVQEVTQSVQSAA